MDKITLDGKKITLPMSFEDFDKECKIFSEVDYSKFTIDNSETITISDKKTKYNLDILIISKKVQKIY